MCQCPERGDLHFHLWTQYEKRFHVSCVNALKGATFISTERASDPMRFKEMCQCPERGDLHFHLTKAQQITNRLNVSMP